MAAPSSSKKVIYAAFLGNLLVALTKFGAAWWTGSSAMLSEAIHSVVDTSNQLLLLYGMHRATRPPDQRHPLGHGRELYFWIRQAFPEVIAIFVKPQSLGTYQLMRRRLQQQAS
jgi:divalent metal cation (Fe/Co/Zn/Cd) transporter